jgi:phosphate transport system substrate-binding protein
VERRLCLRVTSFILMPKQPKDPAKSKIAIDLFRWSLESGRDDASSLNYVPLPAELIERIERYWKSDFGA